jgi:hypothetical protein
MDTPNDSEIFLRAPNCVSLLMVQKLRLLGTWAGVLLEIRLSKPLIAPSALLRLAGDVVPTVGFFVIDEYFGVAMYSNYLRGHVVPSEFGKEKHETLEN